MGPFANVDDYEARYGLLTVADRPRITLLLGDASAHLRALCGDVDERLVAVPPALEPELDPTVPAMIVCAMVKRAQPVDGMVDGVTATQQTAGPFSQSVSFANPTGNLFLTKAERRLLGCGGQRAFSVDMTPARAVPVYPWEIV